MVATPVISALKRLRQESHEFKASLGWLPIAAATTEHWRFRKIK
jgi:hypothetical protein